MAFLDKTGLAHLWEQIIDKINKKTAEMVDSAPETLNTLNELAAALGDDPNFATTVANQIGTKANASDLTAHISNHAPANAQPNQNAFSNVTVGSTTIAADQVTDTLTLVAGSNISITPDAGNDKITIAATNTNTSHSHSAGVGLVGSGSAGTGSGTYNYKAKLRNETALTIDSAAATTTSGRVYPVVIDKSGYLAVNVPWTNTDTHYTTGLKVGASASATTNAAATNGNVYLNLLDNTTIRDSHKIVGSGATTVTSDANGVITISSTDTNTTYGVVSTTADGLAPKRDGSTTKFLRADGNWAVPPDTNTHAVSSVNSKTGAVTLTASDVGALDKLTYEWNKQYNAGGTAGYLLIGSFPMYDTNVTIDIDATTSTTYHGTVVIATQNVSETSMGSSRTITVYGDPTGAISDAIRVTWASGSRNYNVYFVPSTWSKNLIHIRAIGNYLENIDNSKICTQFTTGTAPATTSGLSVVNALRANFNNYAHPSSHPASMITGLSTVATSGKYSDLSGLPTIPSVGNGTVTIKQNGTSKGSFTLNQSGNATIELTDTDTNTTYSAATQSAAGLMSAADKKKLDGIATGANNYTYTLPAATSSALGGVKIGSNITNSSGTISLTKSNVTSALGYTPPTTNTTYSNATTSAAGLMSADDKKKLNKVVYSGSKVCTVSATAGTINLPFSDFGISSRPNVVIASLQTYNGIIQYDFDGSSSQIVLKVQFWNGSTFVPMHANGVVRLGIIIMN